MICVAMGLTLPLLQFALIRGGNPQQKTVSMTGSKMLKATREMGTREHPAGGTAGLRKAKFQPWWRLLLVNMEGRHVLMYSLYVRCMYFLDINNKVASERDITFSRLQVRMSKIC